VKIHVPAERRDQMLAAALEDAKCSVRDEPGCQRFDVLIPAGTADQLALYEVYDDQAALDAHRQTPHLKAFRAAVQSLGARTEGVACNLISEEP
jgi:quinol monooxygenase YgiN